MNERIPINNLYDRLIRGEEKLALVDLSHIGVGLYYLTNVQNSVDITVRSLLMVKAKRIHGFFVTETVIKRMIEAGQAPIKPRSLFSVSHSKGVAQISGTAS